MIFHKIYNIYIHTCDRLIRELLDTPQKVDDAIEMTKLSKDFEHPFVELLDKSEFREWIDKLGLEKENVQSKSPQTMPEYALTKLEKRWLKTISLDPRMRLFDVSFPNLEDVEPLYHFEDIVYFDRTNASDPWTDKCYIEHFKTIYRAWKEDKRLALIWRDCECAGWLNCTNMPEWGICKPMRIEYDCRLDVMILFAECEYQKRGKIRTILMRIPMRGVVSCRQTSETECSEIWKPRAAVLRGDSKRMMDKARERIELRQTIKPPKSKKNCTARLLITDNKDALSRALYCFSSYQKRDIVPLDEENKYALEFYYDRQMDMDSIINDILSLGENVCIESPEDLKYKISSRWKRQKQLQNRIHNASIHMDDKGIVSENRSNMHDNTVSFEDMKPFIVKVVVTRPNTEVRICCLHYDLSQYPQTDACYCDNQNHFLYEADCDGDGIYEKTGLTDDLTHVYEKPGVYTIALRGGIHGLLFRDGKHGKLTSGEIRSYLPDSDNYYWSEVCQWGDIVWQSMNYMFAGACAIRIRAKDAPDLSHVTDMSGMFYNCIEMNDSLEHWDVSHVQNMDCMFERATKFNQPLEVWNVSHVQNMSNMFAFASSFNQPLCGWDVSNVHDMTGMFKMAESFDQPLDKWDVSNVCEMDGMFCGAISFHQNVDVWNISGLKSSNNMFAGALSMVSLPKWRNRDGI